MDISEPRLRSLLRQADRVAEAGKLAAAESLYRQIIEEAPQAEAAWIGLAQVVQDPAEKESAYARALDLAPANAAAQAGLAVLRGGSAGADPAPDDGDPFSASRSWLEEATRRQDGAAREQAPPAVTLSDADGKDGYVAGTTAVSDPPSPPTPATQTDSHELVCYRHPDRATALRCYKCANPICGHCAIKTPVGYLCPTCNREAEDAFFNARPLDYLIAPLVALPLSLAAGFLVTRIGTGFFFILLMIFIGGAVGGLIGRLSKRAVGGRRGRYLPRVVAAMVVLGVVIPALPIVLFVLFGNSGAFFALLGPGIFLFTAASAAYYQMK
jgi:hypothetical protein